MPSDWPLRRPVQVRRPEASTIPSSVGSRPSAGKKTARAPKAGVAPSGRKTLDEEPSGPESSRLILAPVPNAQGLRADIVTVAESLQGLGYATGHFGKWHLGSDARVTGPKGQGFDVSPPELLPARDGGDDDEKPEPCKKGATPDPKRTTSITKAACDFIETNMRRPFFAYLAHHAIHTPIQAKESTPACFRADAAKVSRDAALFAACTYDLDESVGVLLRKLEDFGLDRNTLVILTSDHGGTPASINEPLRGAKGAYYEAGIRVPFFARWPGRIAPGS